MRGIRDVLSGLRVLTTRGSGGGEREDLDIYVGSEGILGFITEVELAVRPAVPETPFPFSAAERVQGFIDKMGGELRAGKGAPLQ